MFELNLDRLSPGRSAFELKGALGADEDACRLDGALHVDSMDQKVLIHGEFEADRSFRCDRCATSLRRVYPAEIEVLVLRSPVRGQAPDLEDDNWVIHQQGGVLKLDEPLHEAVVLHEPQHVLCREDCKGLCPHCGADRNETECGCRDDSIDPRWQALAQLRDSDSGPAPGAKSEDQPEPESSGDESAS